MKALRRKLEALCHKIVPDLAGQPLYVIFRSELPFDSQEGHGADACTGRRAIACTSCNMDLILRPVIEHLDRWQGRGIAMVIDLDALAAENRTRSRAMRKLLFPPNVRSVTLHELAHALDIEAPGKTELSAEVLERERPLLADALSGADVPTHGPDAPIPWRRHEPPFTRMALHLCHRAHASGIGMGCIDVFYAEDYGLSSTWRYFRALDDEPARLAHCDFATIRRTPLPAVFMALWQDDLAAWSRQAEQNEESVKMLTLCEHRTFIPMTGDNSMLTELLDELKNRRKTRVTDFQTLVKSLVNGKKVSVETVETVLAQSGKTEDELQTAVELAQKRTQWAETVASVATLEKEIPTAQEKIAEADRRLKETEKRHGSIVLPLTDRMTQIRTLLGEAREARQKLTDTCTPELKAEAAAVDAQLAKLRAKALGLRKQAGRVKEAESDMQEAGYQEAGTGPGSDPRRAAEWRERAEWNRRAGEKAKAERPGIEAEIAKLEHEFEMIQGRMLEP